MGCVGGRGGGGQQASCLVAKWRRGVGAIGLAKQAVEFPQVLVVIVLILIVLT